MKRKPTKKQLAEAKQKAALRQRVRDIACGAAGYNFDTESEFAMAEFLSRFVPALQCTFGTDENEYLWKPHCLHAWNNIDSSTEMLWNHRNSFQL